MPQLGSLVFSEEVNLIRIIPLSKRKVDDKLVWHYDKRGLFTVKSVYHVTRLWTIPVSLTSPSFASNSPYFILWEKLWCALIPPKEKMMAWRILSNIIPTGVNLTQKWIHIDPSCIMCGLDQNLLIILCLIAILHEVFGWPLLWVSTLALCTIVKLRAGLFKWL